MAKSDGDKRTTGLHRVITGYFKEHPNELVHIDDLHMVASMKGISQVTDQGIQSSLSYMRHLHREGKNPVFPEQVVKGVSWKYTPADGSSPVNEKASENKKPQKRMFEEIGVTKTGAIVAQDTEGNLYRVTEME